jgi:iron complex transport system substrate-binding protein
MRDLDQMTGAIVDAALKIHRELGPGLLESVCEAVLARALEWRGFHVERQKALRWGTRRSNFGPVSHFLRALRGSA